MDNINLTRSYSTFIMSEGNVALLEQTVFLERRKYLFI